MAIITRQCIDYHGILHRIVSCISNHHSHLQCICLVTRALYLRLATVLPHKYSYNLYMSVWTAYRPQMECCLPHYLVCLFGFVCSVVCTVNEVNQLANRDTKAVDFGA